MQNQAPKRISNKEALIRMYEDTNRQLEQYRLGGSEQEQNQLKDSPKRVGKTVLHQDLHRRVQKLNPRIVMESSLHDNNVAGFYEVTREGKRFVCAFHKGNMPEWSIVHTDAADLPVREHRGWRTVLQRLMQRKLLTFTQVSEIVRDIHGYSPDEWNKLWWLNTRDFR